MQRIQLNKAVKSIRERKKWLVNNLLQQWPNWVQREAFIKMLCWIVNRFTYSCWHLQNEADLIWLSLFTYCRPLSVWFHLCHFAGSSHHLSKYSISIKGEPLSNGKARCLKWGVVKIPKYRHLKCLLTSSEIMKQLHCDWHHEKGFVCQSILKRQRFDPLVLAILYKIMKGSGAHKISWKQ